MTIKEKVLSAKATLSTMTTHTQLRDWAIANGMDNRAAFPKFKSALTEIGMDYEQIRSGVQQDQAEDLAASITHELTLYTDAKASAERYGITDEEGNPVWYGRFFDNDDAREQSKAELCSAEKAVWFASKVMEAAKLTAMRLILKVDAQWLVYQDHAGQKGYKLTQKARKHNIELVVEWVPGKLNPADKFTVCSGYKKWQDNDLAALAKEHSSI